MRPQAERSRQIRPRLKCRSRTHRAGAVLEYDCGRREPGKCTAAQSSQAGAGKAIQGQHRGQKYCQKILDASRRADGFCYGHAKVAWIVHRTELQTQAICTETTVTYVAKVPDRASWGKLPEAEKAFQSIKTMLDEVGRNQTAHSISRTKVVRSRVLIGLGRHQLRLVKKDLDVE